MRIVLQIIHFTKSVHVPVQDTMRWSSGIARSGPYEITNTVERYTVENEENHTLGGVPEAVVHVILRRRVQDQE